MKNIKDIAKKLVNLNIKEINELSKILNKKYGINYTNVNNNNITNDNITNKKEINTEDKDINNNKDNIINKLSLFDIYLKSVGTVKLPVIKLINTITGLSLTDSKKLIDNIPSLIKKSVKLDEAKKIQEDFKKIEADIEFKESK